MVFNMKYQDEKWFLTKRNTNLVSFAIFLQENDMHTEFADYFESCWNKIPSPFELDEDVLPEETDYFTAPFNRSRMDQ